MTNLNLITGDASMEVTASESNGYTHLKPAGRIDSSTAGAFEQVLLSHLTEKGSSVLVDFSQVDFVSSAGLRVFLLGAKKVKGTAVSMVLCAMDDNIRRVFAMSGFDRILKIADDVQQGQQMMSA